MKQIPNEFNGTRDQGKLSNQPAYVFKLLKRSGMTCLFEKSRGGKGAKDYEVVILRSVAEKTFPNGEVCPAHESMPSPETWGTSAWSPPTLEAAERKFTDVSLAQELK